MKRLIGALMISVGTLVAAAPASAAVICNEDGDCWRTKAKHDYKPEFQLRIYDDGWKWEDRDRDRYRWRDAGPGRGYWRKGVWVEF